MVTVKVIVWKPNKAFLLQISKSGGLLHQTAPPCLRVTMNQPRSWAAAPQWIGCRSERYRWRRRLLVGLHVTPSRTSASLCRCSPPLHMGGVSRCPCVTLPDRRDMWAHKSPLRLIWSHVTLVLGWKKDKIEMRTYTACRCSEQGQGFPGQTLHWG